MSDARARSGRQRPDQRERLVDAMLELCAESGYLSVSVAQVSARAKVSSATFYEQFADKEDCLLAAYQTAARRVLSAMRPALDCEDWETAASVALDGLVQAVQRDPHAGRVLFVEALSGSSRVRATRDRVLANLEQTALTMLDRIPAEGRTLDVPVTAIMGGIRSLLSRHLRTHSADRLPELVPQLVSWIGSYAIPLDQPRWSTSADAVLAEAHADTPTPAPAGAQAERLPRGRHGLPAGFVARSQRRRIIHGTAEVIVAKGYAKTTVSDIVSAAGIARDVFYEHFTNKQHAFLEAQQHATQHIVNSCAAAYFAEDAWPERVCAALECVLELIAANPTLAQLRIVESYAAGPEAVRSTEEMTRAAGIFLQEGFHYRPQASALPPLCTQAITGAVFELIYGHIAAGRTASLPRYLPQLAYVAIAPFAGPREAVELLRKRS